MDGGVRLVPATASLAQLPNTGPLYFTHLAVSSLPRIVIATAAFSIVLVAISAKAFRQVPPTTFVPAAFGLSAMGFVGEWVIARSAPSLAAQLVYLHVSGLGPILGSGFWLIVTEHFDPRTAKKRFGQIAAVGTLGGVVGGLVAERVATLFGMAAMLPVLAALSVICAVQISRLPRSSDQRPRPPALDLPNPQSGLKVLASTPYLRHLAALVFLGTTGAVLVDYVFKANPIVGPTLDDAGTLTFHNAATDRGVAAAPGGYRARWLTFDNTTRETHVIAETAAAVAHMPAPAGIPTLSQSIMKVEVSATDAPHPSWTVPVDLYFRRSDREWRLIGLERMPDGREIHARGR